VNFTLTETTFSNSFTLKVKYVFKLKYFHDDLYVFLCKISPILSSFGAGYVSWIFMVYLKYKIVSFLGQSFKDRNLPLLMGSPIIS